MNSIAHVCYSISDNSVNVQEKINGDRKYLYPTPVTQWKSTHWCMTSQVMPCRNFYPPSDLQESYLGCRFELGSLQEGSSPFYLKDQFGVELTIYACIWNILRGDQQILLGILLISFWLSPWARLPPCFLLAQYTMISSRDVIFIW